MALCIAALLIVRPPGRAPAAAPPPDGAETPRLTTCGDLPGVTWADDIHPIFVRNRCGDCHTRGREARVEDLTEFSLGLIDPENPTNPFYSYHELVYAEGPPTRMKGEALRDGRCCWPREALEAEKRRIWPGHPERSVLLRKLERDYYGWNQPPRFLEEGLRLRWGLPMPWSHAAGDDEFAAAGPHDSGAATAPSGQGHGHPEPDHPGGYEDYPLRSWPARIVFRAGLWLGGGERELVALPPAIPAADRMLLRQWILDTAGTGDTETGLELQVSDPSGRPVAGAPVELVGNYTSPERRGVEDRLFLSADANGRVQLVFPRDSVVTRTWHARVAGFDREYTQFRLVPGSVVPGQLTAPLLPQGVAARTGGEAGDHHGAMRAVKTQIPAVYREMKRPAVAATAQSLARGKALFLEHCSACHGESGRGDGPAAAGLAPTPADFLDAPHSDLYGPGEKFWIITHGLPKSAMSGFADRLSDAERWALVAHLWQLQGKWETLPAPAGSSHPHPEGGNH